MTKLIVHTSGFAIFFFLYTAIENIIKNLYLFWRESMCTYIGSDVVLANLLFYSRGEKGLYFLKLKSIVTELKVLLLS